MSSETHAMKSAPRSNYSRRSFLCGTIGLPLLGQLLTANAQEPAPAPPAAPTRKIKTGFVGLGGRGSWLADHFKSHGGYEFWAAADYFPHVVENVGNSLGVDKSRRFSGLSGYMKVIESGVEAIVLEVIPYFFPEMAKAAAEAGVHVYMAKPVASDVPGCLQIEAAGALATQKQRVFMIDYQAPTDPMNIEVVKRIHAGALGKVVQVITCGNSDGFSDPPLGTLESRMQGLVWVNDIALGCDNIGNYDIHALDIALWVLGERPVSATGTSRIARADPHGDARDVIAVTFEYASGAMHIHTGEALSNINTGELSCRVNGTQANAMVTYWGKAFLRGGHQQFGGGDVANLYTAGAQRNIATFYQNITGGRFDNPTIRRSVDGCLASILGREAAARRKPLTMDELIKENKRLEVDISSLKV